MLAQREVAQMSISGIGTKESSTDAFKWYTAAASNGDAVSAKIIKDFQGWKIKRESIKAIFLNQKEELKVLNTEQDPKN